MARRSSGESGAAALERVIREAGQGWPAGLTVLTGSDLYHLDRAQRVVIETLVPDESSGFGLTVFGDHAVDVSTVVASVRSAGMFAERRVVLLRDVDALNGDPGPIVSFAKAPPATSFLVVRAPALDKRRKLHQALCKSGRVIEFEPPAAHHAGRLVRDVEALARSKGCTLDRQLAAMLAEICGGDFYRIDSEIEKIRAWQGGADAGRVTREALREVVGGSAALSGWEVARALLHRDLRLGLAALQRLLDGGEEPLRLLGGLAYRARSIVQARAMVERGVPAARAVKAARIWGEEPGRAARGIERYSLAEVLAFPARLLEADRTLKSRALAPRAVLGAMLEEMMKPGPGRAGGRA